MAAIATAKTNGMTSPAGPAGGLAEMNHAIKRDTNRTAIELRGRISKVIFHGDDGYFVAEVVDREGNAHRVIGNMDGDPHSGVPIRFLGKWKNSHTRGWQFAFESHIADAPASRASITMYLAAHCPRIGPAKASKLWDLYADRAVEMLRQHPEQIVRDGILGFADAAEAQKAMEKIAKFEQTRIDLFELVGGRGFPRKLIDNLINVWGLQAPGFVRRDPFVMLARRFRGVGFKLTDQLYIELGLPKGKLKRQMFAAWHVMRSDSTGNTWFPVASAKRAIVNAAGFAAAKPDEAMQLGVRAKWLAKHTEPNGRVWVTEHSKAFAEDGVAQAIYWLSNAKPNLWPQDGYQGLSDHQAEKIRPLLQQPIAILAGTPGTGKTYTAAAILKEVVRIYGADEIAVAAPTGKAAVRITEAMARYQLPLTATTIHKMLGIGKSDDNDFVFQFNEGNKLPKKFVVIDEVSMLDTDIAFCLFSALAVGTHVLLIGDPYQLPPVGHGAVLRDLIAAGLPTALLTEIQRNSGLIVEACRDIKDGKRFAIAERFDTPENNLRMVETDSDEEQIETLEAFLRAIQSSRKNDPIWDVQILVALNDKGVISRKAINARLQGLLNPAMDDTPAEQRNLIFRVGDKVICLRNNMAKIFVPSSGDGPKRVEDYYQAGDSAGPPGTGLSSTYIANGDMGRVLATSPKAIIVEFLSPSRIVKVFMDKPKGTDGQDPEDSETGEAGGAKDYSLAYAITTHKSQGSEWPFVIVLVDDAAGLVASREHHYTAISRGKAKVLIIGKRKTLERQLSRIAIKDRKTFLAEKVRTKLSPVGAEKEDIP